MFDWISARLWGFFASVKIAIIIISLIAIASVFGTLIPQQDTIPSVQPAVYYATTYGNFGKLMYGFGFTHMYTSTWYLALLIALGISLIVCSWERIVPLFLSLKRQPVTVKPFLLAERGLYTSTTVFDRSILLQALQKKRYRVKVEGDAFLAEKGRFARFGAYVIHIGLLLVIAGAMMRIIPGFYYTGNILVDEGQTVHVPTSNFEIRNDKAFEQQYANGNPSLYETDATIYENGKKILSTPITVNHPLKYDGYILFQSTLLPLQYHQMGVSVKPSNSNQVAGQFQIDFQNPQEVYQAGAYKIRVLDYFPDFQGFDSDGNPSTKSSAPYAPAMVMEISGPHLSAPVKEWFVPSAPFLQAELAKKFPITLSPVSVNFSETSGLRVQKDEGIPVVYAGCAVVILGLVIAFYFQHRRIWGNLVDGTLHLGGQTNKNWYAFQKEFSNILQNAKLSVELIRTKKKDQKGGKD